MSSLKSNRIKSLKVYTWRVICKDVEGEMKLRVYGYTKEESLAVLQEYVKTHFREDYGRFTFEAVGRGKFMQNPGSRTDYETVTEQRRLATMGRHEKSFEQCIKSRAGL